MPPTSLSLQDPALLCALTSSRVELRASSQRATRENCSLSMTWYKKKPQMMHFYEECVKLLSEELQGNEELQLKLHKPN